MQRIAESLGVYVLRRGDVLTAYAAHGHDYLDETDVAGCDDVTVQELAQELISWNTQERDHD